MFLNEDLSFENHWLYWEIGLIRLYHGHDNELSVDLLLQSLYQSIFQYIMNYHMNKLDNILPESLKMLKIAEGAFKNWTNCDVNEVGKRNTGNKKVRN